jgi:hypothetical protein
MNEPGFPKLWPLMHFDQVKRHEFITPMRNLPKVMLRAPVCPRGLNAPPAGGVGCARRLLTGFLGLCLMMRL